MSKNIGGLHWILIGWFIKLSVQTIQPLILIYRSPNFVYNYWRCTSIYRPRSCPFISLSRMTFHIHIWYLKYSLVYEDAIWWHDIWYLMDYTSFIWAPNLQPTVPQIKISRGGATVPQKVTIILHCIDEGYIELFLLTSPHSLII